MSRRYLRVALGRQWVKSCPLMAISPACGGTCGRLVPVVMAVPPKPMPGVWQVGGVVQGGCCAPVMVRAKLFRVDRVGGGATARSW